MRSVRSSASARFGIDNENPVFPLTFTVALVPLVAAVVLLRRQGPPAAAAARWTIVALALYGIAVVVTMAIHIPLNEDIDGIGDPASITDGAVLAVGLRHGRIVLRCRHRGNHECRSGAVRRTVEPDGRSGLLRRRAPPAQRAPPGRGRRPAR